VRESRAQTHRAAQPGEESVVGRGAPHGKLGGQPVETKSPFGQLRGDRVVRDEITVQVSSTGEDIGETHA
jgi:hypothetical protein